MITIAIVMAFVSLGFFIWSVWKVIKESKSPEGDAKDDEDFINNDV